MADIPVITDPIPSNKLQVLDANTRIIDEWTNSQGDYTQDRFGVQFKTRYKILYDLQTAVNSIQQGSFLPLSGGTLTGDLTIRKNGVSQYWLGDTTNQFGMYWNGSAGGFNSPTSSGTITRLRYTPGSNNSSGIWNFENSAVTINNVPVLKQGDAGINTRALPLLNDFKSLDTPSGIYRAFGANVPNIATPNAPPLSGNATMTVTVRSNGAVSHYEVIENAGGNPIKWIGECYTSSGSLVIYWTKVITTANVGDYQNGMGFGQTWQNVLSNRSSGITYTNNTNKPICVMITPNGIYTGYSDFYVDGLLVSKITTQNQSTHSFPVTMIVPPGSTYSCTLLAAPTYWVELR